MWYYHTSLKPSLLEEYIIVSASTTIPFNAICQPQNRCSLLAIWPSLWPLCCPNMHLMYLSNFVYMQRCNELLSTPRIYPAMGGHWRTKLQTTLEFPPLNVTTSSVLTGPGEIENPFVQWSNLLIYVAHFFLELWWGPHMTIWPNRSNLTLLPKTHLQRSPPPESPELYHAAEWYTLLYSSHNGNISIEWS